MAQPSIRILLARRAQLQAELREIDAEIQRRVSTRLRRFAEKGLSTKEAEATVNEVFTNVARVAMSASKADGDPLIEAANLSGYSMRQLADKVTERLKKQRITCSQTLISLARSGVRPIRRKIVVAIQDLTGFPATAENWPGGISDR